MGDDAAYLDSLVVLWDQFVNEMKPALGDAARERAVVERSLEAYRANRRALGIWPDDEGQTHFFLADGVIGGTEEQDRGPPIDALGLDKAGGARISDLFLDVLGI